MILELTNHTMELATSTQAAGFFDWANNKTNDAQNLLKNVIRVVGIVVFIIIAWRSKSVGGVILGVIVGGFIFASPNLIEFFGNSTNDETNATGPDGLAGQHLDYIKAAYLA